jgi:tetratricopeptide (TPR) repeat protein
VRGSGTDHAFQQLIQLPTEATRNEFLRRHPRLLQPHIVETLAEIVREKVRVNLDEALRAAESALHIARITGDRRAIAQGLRARGNALHFLGQNKEAVSLHAQAADLFESEGDAKELGRTLSASIQPLILLGEYDRALAVARRAQQIFAGLSDKLRLARLQINIGNIYHRQDRFSEALACYESAHSQLLPLNEAEGIASSLHNTAVCLISLNDFRKATAVYEQARAFCEQHQMPLAVVQADYNIAYLHYLRGKYSLAVELLRTTRDKAEKAGDPYHAALCRLDLAEIYLEINLVDEAAGTAQEAFLRFQQMGMRYEAAKALTTVAIVASRQGRALQALDLLVQARVAFSEERNSVWPSLIDLYRATILLTEKQYGQSRRLSLKALRSFESSQLTHRVVLCRLMLAHLDLCVGNTRAASRACLRTLKEVKTLDTPFLAHQLLFLLGQVHETNQDYTAAYRAYQSAREQLETLRSNLHREELKIAFVKDRIEVYERLVNISLVRPAKHAAREAFQYIEEAKSRTLREALSNYDPFLPARAAKDTGALRRMRDLRETLNWCYHRMEIEQLAGDHRSLERCRQLQELARAHEIQLLKLLREMPNSDAGLTEFCRPARISLTEVREALGPDATLVEFFQVGRQFLASVVTQGRCELVRLADVSSTEASISLLRFQFEKFRLGARYLSLLPEPLLRATQAHLRELYDGLLAPIRHLLRSRHLVFVPHGALHYLPFHALFDGARYLIDSYSVSYAPSAAVLTLCHRRPRLAARRSLVLGVADSRAPNILTEVKEVSSVLPHPEVFVGNNASEEKLKERGPGCAFIHIATHAYFRQDNPLFSGIRLGASYLTLLDLYRMNIPAQLVTLSGCATGMSVVAGGDELLGLIRGFLCAGSHSLVLSLWDVQDAATTLLMKLFYRQLSAVRDRAQALQAAMLEVREKYPHPYYWAPFVLVGNRSR